ncbi:MAG: hypothetical protein FJ271_13975 [Planctomycetes bacterium]|nr:hypothetical protein [Planctomycetota bacterium]
MPGRRFACWRNLSVIALCAFAASHAQGQIQNGNQLPTPRLNSITPLGGNPGTTVDVSFSGGDLELPEAMIFSHAGIKATPIIPPAPPPPKTDPKKPAPPPPPPVTQFKVTIAKDVPPGLYDVRLANKWGVSNPRVFVVGTMKEVAEKEPNNDLEQAQRVELNSTINGVVAAPTDVDYFTFAGSKGQRVVVSCLCASLDSRLHPEMRLLDPEGREIAVFQPIPGQDGILDAVLPRDGDYVVRLCQFTYTQGGGEHFYRLDISTGPWIDAVFPPMIEPGKQAAITIFGRNLPDGKPDPAFLVDGKPLERITVNVTAPKESTRLNYGGMIAPVTATEDGFEYRLNAPAGVSNPALLSFARGPVVIENDANDLPENAQELTVPCEVGGRIDKRGDRDWYVFNAKKGDVFMIEVVSQRLGATTDVFLSLRNPPPPPPKVDPKAKPDPKEKEPPPPPKVGPEIVLLDDAPAVLNAKIFYNLTRDPPAYRFVVPADGKYFILIGSHLSNTQFGPKAFYRLRITPEEPDYRLIVMPPDDFRPDSCVVGKGGSQNFIVLVDRQDGFKGEVTLTTEGLPKGVTSVPQVVGPNVKEALLVVSAAADAPIFTGEIKIKGTASIKGKPVVREARPASVTWPVQPQQNVPTVTRLDRNLVIAVREKPPYQLVAAIDNKMVSHGNKANVKLTLNRLWPDMNQPVQITPIAPELPPGVTFGNVTIPNGKNDGLIVLNVPANVPPGTYSLVFRSFAPVPFAKNPKDKKNNVNAIVPSTPVALTVVPKEVVKLNVAANTNIKAGTNLDLAVPVNRLFDFEDAVKLQLILPPGTQGLSADDAVIPAGKSDGKLVIRVPANAAAGNRANLIVRATATIHGNITLTHEAKININIVK